MSERNWGSVWTISLFWVVRHLRKMNCYLIIFLCFQFQFQRTFESLKNVSNKSDLQKTYQKLGKELENLDYLAFKRQQVGDSPWWRWTLYASCHSCLSGLSGSGETYLLIFRAEIGCAVLCWPAAFIWLPEAFFVVLVFRCAFWGFPHVSLYLL